MRGSLLLLQHRLSIQLQAGGPASQHAAAARACLRTHHHAISHAAGPSTSDAAADLAAAPAPQTSSFDVEARGGLAAYWSHLQFLVSRYGTFRAASSASDPLGACFPFDRAPEVGACC